MTEEEYQLLKPFAKLPLYDEDNSACETIDSCKNSDFTGETIEATDITQAYEHISDKGLVPKGGIRYHGDNGFTIFAYFWRKR